MSLKLASFLFLIITTAYNLQSCRGDEMSDNVSLVRVTQGLINGIKEKSLNGKEFYSYMGIPFAEAPIGKLRFKDPVPSKSWNGVLDGCKMPAYCLQPHFSNLMDEDRDTTILKGKEDCLYLNVYTNSPNEPEKKFQVMVFIHGGAFLLGGAQEYPPYVLMNRDVVYVAVQYRLGIFGFLSTEDSIMPGNMGLKDQQLALKWIKENIASFGGNPESITIFGESAGGASVNYQVLSPGSKGLFNRAIIQSGCALCPWASNLNHKQFAIETGKKFGCSLNHGTESFMKCMQKVNSHFLLIASSEKWGVVPLYVLPRVDGDFISDFPEVLMREGRYNKVDLMTGITRDETAFAFFVNQIISSRMDKINHNFNEFGPYSVAMQNEQNSESVARNIYKYYLKREDITITENDKDSLVEMHGDSLFRVCLDTLSNLFTRNNDVNLYVYRFDHLGKVSLLSLLPEYNLTNLIGHGDDLIYQFEGGLFFSRPLEDEQDLQLRETMLSLWINFAKTGNPNIAGSGFKWEKATVENYRYLSLTSNPRMRDDSFSETRKFWSSLNVRQSLDVKEDMKKVPTFSKQEL